MPNLLRGACAAVAVAVCGVSWLSSCAPGTGSSGNEGRAGATGAGNQPGGGSSGFGAGAGVRDAGGFVGFGNTFGGGGATGIADGGKKCSSDVHEGERLPLDIFFMVDTSGSMREEVQGVMKWQVVSDALIGFLNDPSNADIATGIGYFPQVNPNAPTTCTGNDADCVVPAGDFGPCLGALPLFGCVLGCFCAAADNCSVANYSTPAVPMALPPNHAAVVADIQAHGPAGGTPTRPALDGAGQIAAAWAAQNPGRTTIVVLATDGDPTGCTPNSVQDVANIASTLFATSGVKTFVIGVGNSLTALNQVAASGGSGQAFILDTAGNVAQQFSDALASIRGQAVPCDFKVPTETTSGKVDPTKVNVVYTPRGGAAATIPQAFDGKPENCGPEGGWYYDDPAAPKLLKMCDASCQQLTSGGRVEVQLGCETERAPPPR